MWVWLTVKNTHWWKFYFLSVIAIISQQQLPMINMFIYFTMFAKQCSFGGLRHMVVWVRIVPLLPACLPSVNCTAGFRITFLDLCFCCCLQVTSADLSWLPVHWMVLHSLFFRMGKGIFISTHLIVFCRKCNREGRRGRMAKHKILGTLL